MPLYLRASTASQEVPLGYFLDSTDGNTEETGLTIANTDIKVWKAGATTLASKNSGGATHISNGVYYAVLDATDTDTVGSLVVFCHPTGALATRTECVVLPAAVYDSLIAGTAWGSGAITAASIATGAIDADAIAADAANEIADALLDRSAGVETNRTVRQAMRLILAACAGKASGLATATATYRDTNDSVNRIVATVDADGNRTAVTLDAS